MKNPTLTMAQQIAQVASAFEEQRTGHAPRSVTVVLSDNTLLGGFAAQTKPIPLGVLEEVCRDFDLGKRLASTTRGAPALRADAAADPLPVTRPPANDPSKTVDGERTMFNSLAARPRRRFSFFS